MTDQNAGRHHLKALKLPIKQAKEITLGRAAPQNVWGNSGASPMTIVTYAHRPKRPPRKRKAAPAIPAIVTKATHRTPEDTPPVDDEPAGRSTTRQ